MIYNVKPKNPAGKINPGSAFFKKNGKWKKATIVHQEVEGMVWRALDDDEPSRDGDSSILGRRVREETEEWDEIYLDDVEWGAFCRELRSWDKK